MHKGAIAYLVIGIFLIVVFLLWYLHIGYGKHITTTTTITSLTSSLTTTIINNKNLTSTTTTTIPPIGSCLSSNKTLALENGNFSTGTYEGWNLTGYGFGSAPLNITWANNNSCYYNTTWMGYNGNFFATTYHCGLVLQAGNLTSKPFKVVLPYLNFKIISPYKHNYILR